MGTVTHTVDLILDGIDVYSAFSPPVRLFWVSLTLFDPLVVVLLWTKPRAAVVIGVGEATVVKVERRDVPSPALVRGRGWSGHGGFRVRR